MKKLFFCLFTALAFTGCFMNPDSLKSDYTIINKSSVAVSFTLTGYGSTVYALASGESMTKSLYNNPQLVFSGKPRVDAAFENGETRIYNMPSYLCDATNSSSKTVILTEKNDLAGESGTSYTIAAGGKESFKVYTDSPEFCPMDSTTTLAYTLTEVKDADGKLTGFTVYIY